jgi:hypothetical protein
MRVDVWFVKWVSRAAPDGGRPLGRKLFFAPNIFSAIAMDVRTQVWTVGPGLDERH